MPPIRLVRIDDDLGRVVEEAPESFAQAYGASPGPGRALGVSACGLAASGVCIERTVAWHRRQRSGR